MPIDLLPTPEEVRRRAPRWRRVMLEWFDRYARPLPWRDQSDPYRIWLSEIMLQQTRVEQGIPYYHRFLEAFPTVDALAAASEEAVLRVWEGLGYYSRARNLRRAAGVVAGELGGVFPRTAEGWRRLPGVGRYTAGAIASQAFGDRAGAVDGNVKRVFSRWFDVHDPVDDPAVDRAFHDLADRLVPPASRDVQGPNDPGRWNQSLMELGSLLCRPRRPRCDECPASSWCRARAAGTAAMLPRKRPKKGRPHYEVVAAWLERGDGKVLLGRRPEGKMLAGLWEFPGGKLHPGETHAEGLARELREELGLDARIGPALGAVDHVYTHFSITLTLMRAECDPDARPQALHHAELVWAAPEEFSRRPMPTSDRRLIALLTE